jgi:hypothetical protein
MFHDPQIKDYVYLKADVLPSQRQSNKKDLYKTYIISHKNGEILTVIRPNMYRVQSIEHVYIA